MRSDEHTSPTRTALAGFDLKLRHYRIVRDALETIAVVDSHRPPAQVEAEMTQFLEVALDFVPPKRREDFNTAFQKALKAAT